MTRRRIMREFVINEMSAVDVPAQKGARRTIMKRGEPGLVEKRLRLTTSVEGHAHLFDDSLEGGSTTYSKSEGEQYGHDHPWVRNLDGTVTIGASDGHTHDVTDVAVGKAEFTGGQRERLAETGVAMPDGSFPIRNKSDLKNAIGAFGRAKNRAATAKHIARRARALGASNLLPDDGVLAAALGKCNDADQENHSMTIDTDALKKQLDAANAKIESLSRVLALSTEQRQHYETLHEGERPAFVAKSSTDRDAEVAKKREADPVLYKADDGLEIRRSMDPTGLLAKMAKDADEQRRLAKAERIAREDAELSKRAASELGHLPGEEAVKVALLRKVGEISDEKVRGEVGRLLSAANTALAPAFKRLGATGGDAAVSGDPEEALNKMARERATKDGVSFEVAYDRNLDDNADARKIYADKERARFAR